MLLNVCPRRRWIAATFCICCCCWTNMLAGLALFNKFAIGLDITVLVVFADLGLPGDDEVAAVLGDATDDCLEEPPGRCWNLLDFRAIFCWCAIGQPLKERCEFLDEFTWPLPSPINHFIRIINTRLQCLHPGVWQCKTVSCCKDNTKQLSMIYLFSFFQYLQFFTIPFCVQ